MLATLKNCLLKAQQAMKTQADSKQRDVSYKVGDLIYVKLRPYCQTSVSRDSHHKLSKIYYGPFQDA